MVICSFIKTCAKTVLHLRGPLQKQMRNHICDIASPTQSSSCCLTLKQGNPTTRYSHMRGPPSCFSDCGFRAIQRIQYRCTLSSKRGYRPSLTVKNSVNPKGSLKTVVDFSSGSQKGSVSILVPRRGLLPFKFNVGPFTWSKGSVAVGLVSGVLVCYSTSDSVHAEAPENKGNSDECTDPSSANSSQGKKVYTDYSVIGIPGDGRCLFRSVAHGACLRSGKPAPNESLQKKLADDLRDRVANEFIKRRQETEWFIEGDFDSYVSQIRKPHVWGGEPELLMLSHVLRMPITVYMHDTKHGGLISIAEYGQEYGKDNPIRVLYHGYGHYDALLMPGNKGAKSRL